MNNGKIYPRVELDEIFVDDGKDVRLLAKHIMQWLCRIKRNKERIVVEICLEAVIKEPAKKLE